MTLLRSLRRWCHNERGSVAVEFALIGPTLFAMLLGILWVGLQMQKYNALRSIAADVSRYTVVEYQKDNKLAEDQIESMAAAIAVKSPYALSGDRMDVDVTEQVSPVTGAKNFSLVMSYTPENFLGFIGVSPVTMAYTQNIYVPT